jgi:hypothetical protein
LLKFHHNIENNAKLFRRKLAKIDESWQICIAENLHELPKNLQKSPKIGKNRRKLAKIAENWKKIAENWKKSPKIGKIAKNSVHNIDPLINLAIRLFSSFELDAWRRFGNGCRLADERTRLRRG